MNLDLHELAVAFQRQHAEAPLATIEAAMNVAVGKVLDEVIRDQRALRERIAAARARGNNPD